MKYQRWTVVSPDEFFATTREEMTRNRRRTEKRWYRCYFLHVQIASISNLNGLTRWVCVRCSQCNNNKLLPFNSYNCWNIICWLDKCRQRLVNKRLCLLYFCVHTVCAFLSSKIITPYTRIKWLHKSQSNQQQRTHTDTHTQKIMISFRTKKVPHP